MVRSSPASNRYHMPVRHRVVLLYGPNIMKPETTKRNIVGYRSFYDGLEVRNEPIYYDQFYKLPFWVNVRMKLKRWMRL